MFGGGGGGESAELMALITRRAQQVDELTAKLEHANRARLDAEARHAGEAARSGQLAEQLALLNHRNSIGDRAMMLGTKAKVDAAENQRFEALRRQLAEVEAAAADREREQAVTLRAVEHQVRLWQHSTVCYRAA